MTNGERILETELVFLLQGCDRAAFDYLYDKYAPLLYGLLLRQLENKRIASAILSRVFIKLAKECKTLDRGNQGVFTWLLAQTRETASKEFKVDFNLKTLITVKVRTEVVN